MPSTLVTLQGALAANRERRLLVLAGSDGWARRQFRDLVAAWGGRWCWSGGAPPAELVALPANRPDAALGDEWDGAGIDCRAGLRPDLLGALGGAIRGGGLLVLLTPPLAAWQHWRDPDYDRMAVYPYRREQLTNRFWCRLRELLDEPAVIIWTEGCEAAFQTPSAAGDAAPLAAALEAQSAVVDAIERCGRGRAHRPLVITADRGRGKSAALGMAAARLAAAGRTVLVTGPRPAACDTLFRHASAASTDIDRVRFVPFDALVRQARLRSFEPGAVLLVDEAAALPTDVLAQLLHFPRVVFATTVHGYEGGGRGFELRFLPQLQRRTPQWRRATLTQPLRWAASDPLERWLYRALLLDAAPAAPQAPALPEAVPEPEPIAVNRLDRAALRCEALLRSVYGLLVQAHYRTSPDDLRQLLDGPGLRIWLARRSDMTVAGVLMVAEEGALPADLQGAVQAGQRRPRGHLLPQSLALHANAGWALQQRWLRVVRIAVAPESQRGGIGRELLRQLEVEAAAEGIDCLGVSFAASAGVTTFWRHAGFLPLRIGIRREVGSGAEALMLGKGLQVASRLLLARLTGQLWRQLPLQLADHLRHWEAPGVVALLAAAGPALDDDARRMAGPDGDDRAQALRFATGVVPLESSLDAVARVSRWALAQGALLDAASAALLVWRVFQLRSWAEVVALTAAAGRDDAEGQLRGIVAQLLALDPLPAARRCH